MIEGDSTEKGERGKVTRMTFPHRRCALRELCDYLDVTEPTIYRWMKHHGLPSHQIVRPNGKRYFDLDEIDEWLKSRRRCTTAAQDVAS